MMTPDPPAPCPSRDLLIEAAAPGSHSTVRERVADHVIGCASCAEDYRLLQELAEWAPSRAPLLAGRTAPAAGGSPAAGVRRTPIVLAYAAAAVLAIVVVALTADLRRLQREHAALVARPGTAPLERQIAEQQRAITDLDERLRASETPDLNPPIVDLEPADAPRSAGSPAAAAQIPAGARQVVFVLNTRRRAAGAAYDIEIADAGARVVWSGSGLKQTADGTLTLVVPRTLVAAGSRIRLYSRAAGARTLVEQYVVR